MHFVEQDIRLTRGENLWVARELSNLSQHFHTEITHFKHTSSRWICDDRSSRIELNWKRFYDSFLSSQSSLGEFTKMFTQNDNLIHFKLEFMIQFSRHSLRVIERNWKIGPDSFMKYLVTDLLLGRLVNETVLLEEEKAKFSAFFSVKCQSKLAFGMNYDPSDGKLQIYFNFLPFPEAGCQKNPRQKLHKFL